MALQYWASAKLCSVAQRAPPMFGRAAITLGIGPRSSPFLMFMVPLWTDEIKWWWWSSVEHIWQTSQCFQCQLSIMFQPPVNVVSALHTAVSCVQSSVSVPSDVLQSSHGRHCLRTFVPLQTQHTSEDCWKLPCFCIIFSERELTFTFAICYHPSVCLSSVCLSSVCL